MVKGDVLMKGRNQFTRSEINKLKEILEGKVNASSPKQKPFRDKLRRIGFYITDFDKSNEGFTKEKLEELIGIGIITVKDGK